MGFKLNLTKDEIKEAQGGGFKPLPEGIYGAMIYDAKEAVSKKGNEMYVIDYKITEGPEGVGRKIRAWYTVSKAALFSYVGLAKATDMPYPDKDTPEGEFEFPDAEEFLQKEVNLKIIQTPFTTENDEGEIVTGFNNEVKRVFPHDPDKITEADDEDGGGVSSGSFLN